MEKIAIVLEAGGMRNTFLSGVLSKFDEYGFGADSIDTVYACSSAAITAAYFVTGQIAETRDIWIERLTCPEIMSLENVLRGNRPADVDYLVDVVCNSLDSERLDLGSTKLIVNIVRQRDGEVFYLPCTSTNFRDLLKATCALPLFTRAVEFGGEQYVDGGVRDPFPVQKAYSDKFSKIIVISNRPWEYQIPSWYQTILPWVVFPHCEEKRARFMLLGDHYKKAKQLIDAPPADVDFFVLHPPEPIPCHRFSRCKDRVSQAYEQGQKVAEQNVDRLMDFIVQC